MVKKASITDSFRTLSMNICKKNTNPIDKRDAT